MPKQIFISSVSENLNKVKLQFHVCSYTEVIGGKGKKKHDPVLHISRNLFLQHISVTFYFYTNLRESGLGNMSLRTHIRVTFSKVNKYLLSLLWDKHLTRHFRHCKSNNNNSNKLILCLKKKSRNLMVPKTQVPFSLGASHVLVSLNVYICYSSY